MTSVANARCLMQQELLEAKQKWGSIATFLAVAIYFDIVASAKFYCNEISGVEAKIVFKCNAYFLLQYTLIVATRTRRRG